jgi:hypothetical protein
MKRWILIIVFVFAGFILAKSFFSEDWRSASRESAGIAPDPARSSEAIVQVYGANAWYSGPEKLDSQLSYNQTDEKEKKNVHKTTELQCGVQGKGSA